MTHTLKCILALLLLAGCQNEAIEFPDDNRPNPDGSIGFRLRIEDSLINEDSSKTKGVPHIGLEQYDSVCVNVFSHTLDYEETTEEEIKFFQKVRLEPADPNWKCTPPIFWPTGKKLSFMAYASDITPFDEAGITFEPSTGAPERIIYRVPTDVTRQPDLLVSTKFNQPQVDNVSLNMKHALACVSFCGIAPEEGVYVKSITLRNVYNEGTLTLNHAPIEWTVSPDSKGVTVFEAGIKEDQPLGKDPLPDNNYLMTEDGYLMMIPQELKDAAIDVLYWNGTDETANKIITYMLPVNDESYATWKPGQKYIYKFGSQSADEITVTYYEKYADNAYGLYYNQGVPLNTLDNTKEIVEAGYGVLTKELAPAPMVPIRLTTSTSDPVSSGTVVELADIGSFLYPVSQSGSSPTFALSASSTPVDVYFNNSNKPCGMIVPHFAKGVYTVKTPMKAHFIRTPQQMRNITVLGKSPVQKTHTYTQELDLDFSNTAIGGESLTTSVVNCEFNDVFEGQQKQIKNVKINATLTNGALFHSNWGEIKEVRLLNSSISSSGNTGGIAATNESTGVIYHPRIIGENDSDKKFEVQGLSGYVGAIVGLNYGTITGNNIEEEVATELPVAEVSGWVSIKGASQPVGGITGENQGTITTCLVNGVHVTGPTLGEVEIAKITIEGGSYVGGIVGVNKAQIDGNFSTKGAEPDIAGLVSISGSGNWVGGIAGTNKGTRAVLNQVNIRLGRGDADNAIIITGQLSVGGIVGANEEGGTLKADGNSFISVRGNVRISGTENIGGIVGNNQTGNLSNCFVYNFYSQDAPLVHYAPKISGSKYVGGIVGYAGNHANITKCAVFSTVSAANASGGENIDNARVEINSSGDAVGGVVGRGFSGLTLTANYVLGNVKVEGLTQFCGGIMGENSPGTKISYVHVGNSSAEVGNVYTKIFDAVNLPVRDPRMKTDGKVMTNTSGTPTITAQYYVGGICGVNWGEIDGISMNDNVKIGTAKSTYVGGITGGNGPDAYVKNCKTYNPLLGGSVEIEGSFQVGGISGLNNGIIKQCQVGLPELNQSRLITIKGAGTLGGIAGSTGGSGIPGTTTGNENTQITDCYVYGKVLIEGTGQNVGGILGLNQPTSRVIGCHVIGYTSHYTDASTYNYDVTVKGSEFVGGIAGTNTGEIQGVSATQNSTVTHTAVVASYQYAGGLVGSLKSTAAKLYNCDVSLGVLIFFPELSSGAFAGQLDGGDANQTNPALFGTAPGGPTNRIYTGTTHPVRVSGNNRSVIVAKPIENFVYPKQDPPALGNLWADYLSWNYLYYTAYP